MMSYFLRFTYVRTCIIFVTIKSCSRMCEDNHLISACLHTNNDPLKCTLCFKNHAFANRIWSVNKSLLNKQRFINLGLKKLSKPSTSSVQKSSKHQLTQQCNDMISEAYIFTNFLSMIWLLSKFFKNLNIFTI